MKSLKTSVAAVAVILLSASIFTGCGMYSYGTAVVQTNYANPQWAPPYYDGARYYYLPDIESYYDLSANEFIFLNDGQWVYSRNMPSMYANFDLNNSFAIVLDVNIYQPWMHHQYYASHYPRYYYRDYYDHSNIPYVRGFNENSRSAVYWKENERNRARSWDNENQMNDRKFKYTKDDRQQQKNTNNQDMNRPSSNNNSNDKTQRNPDNNTNSTRNSGNNTVKRQQPATTPETSKTHDTNYYGKTIGKPVKVEKQMQDKRETKSTGRR